MSHVRKYNVDSTTGRLEWSIWEQAQRLVPIWYRRTLAFNRSRIEKLFMDIYGYVPKIQDHQVSSIMFKIKDIEARTGNEFDFLISYIRLRKGRNFLFLNEDRTIMSSETILKLYQKLLEK